MKQSLCVLMLLTFGLPSNSVAPSRFALTADDVPQSVEQLWADFDPRKDALETEVIREFQEDGGVFRHVRFVVGTFKGKTARMTATYGFPDASTAKSSNAGTNEKLPEVSKVAWHYRGRPTRDSCCKPPIMRRSCE